MQQDLANYCKSCYVCQKTISKGRIPKARLGRMPLIDILFRHVAMDLVGPIHPIHQKMGIGIF